MVSYQALAGETPFKLKIFPLINFRSYHSLARRNDSWSMRIEKNFVEIISPCRFYLICHKGSFKETGYWYYDMTYLKEKERGLDYKEDHFNPVALEVELKAGEKADFICSTELLKESQEELLQRERRRAEMLIRKAEIFDRVWEPLILSADSFIVDWLGRRSVIAGYHWFTDWGRDAMVSLPGLCLPTGRQEEAKEIIFSFLEYLKGGLIPNAFMEGERIYNSVDGVLWLFWAVYQILKKEWEKDFAEEVFPYLLKIVEDLIGGKAERVFIEADGLISAGDEEVCMTWMDAKVKGKPVIARHGKAVEVNALWIFALGFLEELAFKLCKDYPYKKLFETAVENFLKKFEAPVGLYDVERDSEKDTSIRPNQVIAGALPFVPIPIKKRKEIARIALEELYTPFGLRSLSKKDANYRGHYEGGPEERDSAYHQGTVWPYLVGFLFELLRNIGETRLEWLLEPFRSHLSEAGLGTISEIFDGDYPWTPRGCISQAWSVGEILRIIWELGRANEELKEPP